MAKPHEGGPGQDELVDARELRSADEDRFRHADVVAELAALVTTVPTPANIALFGPYGSGKSGIANLLAERLRREHPEVAFARFDAFKFAEVPLRRQFLADLARQLSGPERAKDLSDQLYTAQKRTVVHLQRADLWRGLRVLACVAAATVGISVVVAAVITLAAALTTEADFPDGFGRHLLAVIRLLVGPATLLGLLATLAGRTLPIEQSSSAPDSEEQFERLFAGLVAGLDRQPLVVFVDELDRCASDEVVTTLDTLRTFLGIEGCVFVVAADQQVLERALSERVRQATPADEVNPYYSSGSAYLDKVFQYQVELPALLPRRLTELALSLVRGRSGLWQEVEAEYVVSVLVPTHVRSPRRVKVLLNNFAVAYRLARRREEAGQLPEGIRDRALELAKLVCLRTEFPLFARELATHHRLPGLLLLRASEEAATRPNGVSEEAWERAGAFAQGERWPDQLLLSSGEATAEQDGEADEVRRALREELVAYLHKTTHIPDPGRDLILLESAGTLFGLDGAIAEELEQAAVDGRLRAVESLANAQDDATQVAMIRLLAQRTREAAPGVEGENLAGALLALAASRSPEVLADGADEAIEALEAHQRRRHLRTTDLAGAFELGLRARPPGGPALVTAVLGRAEVRSDPDLNDRILARLDRLLPDHLDEITALVNERVLEDPDAEHLAEVLAATDDLAAHVLIVGAKDLATLIDDKTSGGVAAESPLNRVDTLCDALLVGSPALVEPLAHACLLANTEGAVNVGAHWLHEARPVRTRDATLDALRVAADADARDLDYLLQAVEGSQHLGPDEAPLLDAVVSVLWRRRAELDGQPAELLYSSMVSVERLQEPRAELGRGHLVDEAVVPAGTDVALADRVLGNVRLFVDHHLLPEADVATAVASALSAHAARAYAPQPVEGPAAQLLVRWSTWAVAGANARTARDLVEAITACTWMPSPAKENVSLRCASLRNDIDDPLGFDAVVGLVAAHGGAAAPAVAAWINTFLADAGDAIKLLAPILGTGTYPDELRSAVASLARRLDPRGHLELATPEIEVALTRRPNLDFLRDAELHEADQQASAELLVSLYARATRNEQRERLLDVWTVLAPTSVPVRHRLIDELLLPTLAGSQQGYQLVKARPALWTNPEGRRRAIKEAMRRAAGGQKGDKKLEELLSRHGVVRTRRSGLLGLARKEVDEA